jgi:lysophosphatidate acyltransferase
MSADKTKLFLFPEGTRNKGGQEMLPFKKGAFHMAISCQAPIMPIVYSPYYFINTKTRYFGSGNVYFTFF